MIQKGIFAKTFTRKNVLEVLKAVRQNGFSVAQFNFACVGLSAMPKKIPSSLLKEINIAKSIANIELVGVSGTFNMAHPDKAVRADGLQRFAIIAAACPAIDTKLITLCTGSRDTQDKWKHHPQNTSKEAWKDMVDSMEQALLIAEKFDLELGIEPELANVVNSPKKALQLIKDMGSDRLKIVLDPANLFEKTKVKSIKYLIRSAIDLLAPHIVMAHAKDRNKNGDFIAPGQGVIPFDFFVQQLQQAGINCPLVAHGFTESEVNKVSAFLDTLK